MIVLGRESPNRRFVVQAGSGTQIVKRRGGWGIAKRCPRKPSALWGTASLCPSHPFDFFDGLPGHSLHAGGIELPGDFLGVEQEPFGAGVDGMAGVVHGDCAVRRTVVDQERGALFGHD